ncbi:hypothetical protein DFH07DRAFT_765794 [Mycena maculata]|uniref:Uncharacterized protein n=1 Tax=Mycena maculata TaxID=230809 RepID=A0AAD7KBA5_9AGAR|nr:hypothetical protein DFH07DRAFT_765794 [Mycena maculata]
MIPNLPAALILERLLAHESLYHNLCYSNIQRFFELTYRLWPEILGMGTSRPLSLPPPHEQTQMELSEWRGGGKEDSVRVFQQDQSREGKPAADKVEGMIVEGESEAKRSEAKRGEARRSETR